MLVWASELGSWSGTLKALAPTCRFDEPWETLLGCDVADWVLVGRARGASQEQSAEQLGKLVRAGAPLAVSFPPNLDVLAAYELEMVREENRATLLPLASTLAAPAAATLLRRLHELGSIEQVVCQRSLVAPIQESVMTALAGDLLLARQLTGELTRVAALAPPGDKVRYDQLGVQLSGPTGALVRWSLASGDDSRGLHVAVVGSQGRAALWLPDEGEGELRLAPRGGSEQVVPSQDPGAAWLGDDAPQWSDAIRGLELAEAVERSLKRGKTIDLSTNEASETGTFKALMSAAGCLLILAAPFALVVALGMARIKPLQPLLRFMPAALALLLVLFLGLQAFRWALPDEPRGGNRGGG